MFSCVENFIVCKNNFQNRVKIDLYWAQLAISHSLLFFSCLGHGTAAACFSLDSAHQSRQPSISPA